MLSNCTWLQLCYFIKGPQCIVLFSLDNFKNRFVTTYFSKENKTKQNTLVNHEEFPSFSESQVIHYIISFLYFFKCVAVHALLWM